MITAADRLAAYTWGWVNKQTGTIHQAARPTEVRLLCGRRAMPDKFVLKAETMEHLLVMGLHFCHGCWPLSMLWAEFDWLQQKDSGGAD